MSEGSDIEGANPFKNAAINPTIPPLDHSQAEPQSRRENRVIGWIKGFIRGPDDQAAVPMAQDQGDRAARQVVSTAANLTAATIISAGAAAPVAVEGASNTVASVVEHAGEFTNRLGTKANDVARQALKGPELAGSISQDLVAQKSQEQLNNLVEKSKGQPEYGSNAGKGR